LGRTANPLVRNSKGTALEAASFKLTGCQISWVIEVLFLFATGFAKISILLFYRRLVAGIYSRTFKWIIWCSIGFVVAYTFVWFILILTTCTPVDAVWKMVEVTYTTTFKCAPVILQQRLSITGGVLSVISDLYSLLLPLTVLFRLKISTKQKIGLSIIFGSGIL
jgi:hypothetical protein